MIINAIKYKSIGQATKAWRFAAASGQRKNFLCFTGNNDEIHNFQQALTFALTGKNAHQQIEEAMVYLADDAGQTWIVHRQGEQVKLQRNGAAVEGDIKSTLLATWLDLDIAEVKSGDLPDIVRNFELSFDQENLIATPRRNTSQHGSSILSIAQNQSTQILDKAARFFGGNALVDEKTIISFYRANESVYLGWLELQKQKNDLAQEIAKGGNHDPQTIAKLENEVAIMERLQSAATPLIDPSQSPQVLKEKLTKIEHELKELCEKHQITALPLADNTIEWEKILDVLSRIEAFGRLEKSTDRAVQQTKESVEPIFHQYVQLIEGILRQETQITLELESCLANLTHEMRAEEPEVEEEAPNWLKKLQNFLPILHGEEDDKAGRSRYDSPANRLEKVRHTVSGTLVRLGELQGNLGDAKKTVGETFSQMDDRREKLSTEYGKLKKNWEHLCAKYNLPAEMSLKTLIGVINNLGRISLLWNERETLQNKMLDQKARLQQLPKLIEELRTTTGSQKETPLDTAAIVLSEARGVLQYYDKKKAQLERLKAHELQSAGQTFLKNYVQNRQDQLRAEWQRNCQLMALPVLPLESKNWGEVFKWAKELESLSIILTESQKPLKNQQIFSERSLDAPITTFLWGRHCGTPQSRLKLLQFVEQAPLNGLALLLVDDTDLSEIIKKFGIATAVEIKTPTAPSSQGATSKTLSTSPVKQQGLISEKAKAALAAFQPKAKYPLR